MNLQPPERMIGSGLSHRSDEIFREGNYHFTTKHTSYLKNMWIWVISVLITKQSHQVEQHRIDIRRNHLQFDGSPWAQKGQRWQWPHPPWAGTFGLHSGEARSLSRVYHRVPSAGARFYPTVREECTWKTQNRPLHLIWFRLVAFHNTEIKPPLCYSEHFKRGCRTNNHPGTCFAYKAFLRSFWTSASRS